MGGRGSSGGGSRGIRGMLPDRTSFDVNRINELPRLQGTEKQVAWAEKIREETLSELWWYTINRDSEGKPSMAAETYARGKDAMVRSIRESPLVSLAGNEHVRNENIQRQINGFRDAKRRLEAYHSISQNTSASFWIDNRTNVLQNYLNRAFKRKIDGK